MVSPQLFDAAPDGIGISDPEGRYMEVNAAYCRMTGYTREELLGRQVADLLRPEDAPRLAAFRAAFHTPGTVQVREWTILRKDGSPLLVEVSATRLPDGRRQAFVRDIRERKRRERLREEWLSVVAHDLQQPVAAIRLYTSLLHEVAARDPEASAPVARIGEVARALHRRIADLLDLSRAEIGQLPLRRCAVDVADLARAAVERIALEAEDRPLCVHALEVRPVSADPDRIGQVLDNLLTNALKYGTPGTPIVVSVEAAGDGKGASVTVTNHGPGIAAEDLSRIFHRFERGDAGRAGVNGTGLGLHIARELCEAHGGRLTAESVPGATTTFRFTLPAETRA